MKKMICLILCLTLLFTACGKKQEEEVAIPNPVVPVDGPEAYAAVDLVLIAPEAAENAKYSLIADRTAQVMFDLEGTSYTFRAAHTEDDISGVYATFDEDELVIENTGVSIRVRSIDGGKSGALATWYHADTQTQYSLYTANAIEKEQLGELASQLAGVVCDPKTAEELWKA